MSVDPLESLLARLLSSPTEVEEFLRDRETYARNCGVACAQHATIEEIDAVALRFAAISFESKRQSGRRS